MERAEFWTLIDEVRTAKGEGTAVALGAVLDGRSRDDVAAFDAWFTAYDGALHRTDLWAAVYLIRGGCGDDRFMDFRSWMICQGESAVLGAVHDPESLADCAGDRDPCDEEIRSAVYDAHARKAGADELAVSPKIAIPGMATWPPDRIAKGVRWSRSLLRGLYPGLYARYQAPREQGRPGGEITHERFWSWIDTARGASEGREGPADVVARLEEALMQAPVEEVAGFDGWLARYTDAMRRPDVTGVCWIVLGRRDHDARQGFCGWLLLQGERTFDTLIRDLDSLAAVTPGPVACKAMMDVATRVLARRGLPPALPPETFDPVRGYETWPDTSGLRLPAKPPLLRAGWPRLTAGRSDDSLLVDTGVARIPPDVRS